MNKIWLVVLCLAGGLWLAGCSDVESCQEATDLGCINTAPRADGSCLFDLVLSNGKCVKKASIDDKCGLCSPGSLCVPSQGQCVDFCAVPTALPGSVAPPTPIFCEAFKQDGSTDTNPMLSFSDVCQRRCELRCERLAQYCTGYKCPDGSCDTPDTQTKCLADCPPPAAGGMDVACLTQSCNDARLTRCGSTITCPAGSTLNCANITCSNDCSFQLDGQAVVGDGVCDDGDVLSSASPYCAWGTDCADCGPRQGTTAPAPADLGGLCEWAENCAGATGKPSTATSWCVGLMTTKASRCMPDCSRGETCPTGFGCFQVTFTDPTTMMDAPVTEGTYTSSACIPLNCQ